MDACELHRETVLDPSLLTKKNNNGILRILSAIRITKLSTVRYVITPEKNREKPGQCYTGLPGCLQCESPDEGGQEETRER